jgi:F-type H+-transporting ATPase subunit gamma
MLSPREIRTKITSIKNTQKITSAMQMVAASKMRRAQNRMKASRPYSAKILDLISHLAGAHPEFSHLYTHKPEVKRVGFIVLTTDRGLCGSLNINVLKRTLEEIKKFKEQNIECELCTVGNKADAFFRRFGLNVATKGYHITDETSIKDFIGTVKVLIDTYFEKYLDVVYICFNEFVNTMVQRPKIEQILPITTHEEKPKEPRYWDYIYEPDSRILLTKLLTRYIESIVYQAAVENIACEQSARMIAMMNATDNAANLIEELQLIYNKTRQAAITREISEIVGGAEAIETG